GAQLPEPAWPRGFAVERLDEVDDQGALGVCHAGREATFHSGRDANQWRKSSPRLRAIIPSWYGAVMLRLSALVQVMVKPGERRRWRAQARREGLTLSDLVRTAVRA